MCCKTYYDNSTPLKCAVSAEFADAHPIIVCAPDPPSTCLRSNDAMLFAGTGTDVANATCDPDASGSVKLNDAADPEILLIIIFVRTVVVAEGTVYKTVVFVVFSAVLAISFDIVAIFFLLLVRDNIF
jgi:hypothetical protein